MNNEAKNESVGRRTISVVVPLLDERPTLEELYDRLRRVVPELADEFEVIFVDDGSRDRSVELLRRFSAADPSFRYIRFRRNFGKSAALAAGFRAARYECIVTLDADLQDLPEQLPLLIEKLDEGYDLVSGWRHTRKDRLGRKLASRIYNWTTARLTGVRLHDINCGFKCYRREVIDEVMVYGEQHRYIPVLASYRGFRLGEVKIEHAPRAHGESRYGMGRFMAGLFSLLTVIMLTRYTNKPLHFFGLLGMLLVAAGVGVDFYLFFQRLFFQEWLSNRPLFIIATMSIIVGIQFVLFGLLAEMVAHFYRRERDYSIVESSDEAGLTLDASTKRVGTGGEGAYS
jgi:glycosyltransferase involved in cell wall biosynthesis